MKFLFSFVTFLLFTVAFAQDINVSSGKIIHYEKFTSKFVEARNVAVWLPDDYSEKEKYAVLYMHDGQMLFDAGITWNKQAWEVDEIAGKLLFERKTKKFIVVGIWNNGQNRHPEYFPQQPYQKLTEAQKEFISADLIKKGKIAKTFNPISDDYLQFLVTELKPFIDTNFATKPNRSNTFICGSSMGGLISIYAICEYPKVFGGAACISTHWTGIYQLDDNPIPEVLFNYLKQKLPNPKNHTLYFDYGDQTLDALYPSLQQKVDRIMKDKGFSKKHWITKYFPGKDHSEKSWSERLTFPLAFLLKN